MGPTQQYNTIPQYNCSTYRWFLVDLHTEEAISERVDHYQDICKLCLEYGASVVSPVLTPHNVNLIIAKVTHLQSGVEDMDHYHITRSQRFVQRREGGGRRKRHISRWTSSVSLAPVSSAGRSRAAASRIQHRLTAPAYTTESGHSAQC